MNRDISIKVGIIGIKGLPAQAGVDRVVEAIVKRYPAAGISPTLFCDSSFTPDDYSLPGVKIVRVKSVPGKHLSAPTRFLVSAIRALFWGDFDLIHLHNVEAGFILPFLRLKYPVISTAHGFAYWRSKWGPVARQLIKWADWQFMAFSSVITSVSQRDAQTLQGKYKKQVIYIPNGVANDIQPNLEKACQVLSGLGLSPHGYFIFVAGRIEPTKGAHLAIEAVNQLNQEIPLLVIGDLEQVPAYKQELQRKAGPRIHFLPLIKDAEILYGLIAQARCLIFPSIVEAMSMVLLEAVSLGCPVLASDIEENRCIYGENIEYFESSNLDSLVQRLQWVIRNDECLKTKSLLTREHILREYGWDQIAQKYIDLYQISSTGRVP